MNKKVVWIIVAIIVLAGIWYLASPLFTNTTINEEFPVQENQDSQQETGSDTLYSVTLSQGQFQDADSFHKTSGKALVVQQSGDQYLRLEDFETTNGPDLYVYLTNDLEAQDYVSLGRLKGNQGNQNYEIPEDVNPEDYQYAVIWCQAFSTLFGSAELQ